MKNISYSAFCKLIESYQTFTNDILDALYNEYGEERINSYFFKYSSKLNENDFVVFANKYAAYYDRVFNNIDNDDIRLSDSDDIINYLINVSIRLPLLRFDEEMMYGKILKEGRKKLNIIKDDETNSILYSNINIEEILFSTINANNYYGVVEKLKELKSLPIKLSDDCILKNEIIYLKKYLKLFSIKKPDFNDLINTFSELNFDNLRIIEQQDKIMKKI